MLNSPAFFLDPVGDVAGVEIEIDSDEENILTNRLHLLNATNKYAVFVSAQ